MAANPDVFVTQGAQYAKDVYADNAFRLYPNCDILMKLVPFSSKFKLGKKFIIPIELAPESGVTRLSPNAGKVALVGAQGLTTLDASLEPYQLIFEREMDYEGLARAAEAGKAAFVSFADATFKSIIQQATKSAELDMLHGQSLTGLGVVSAVGAVSGPAGAGQCALTIADAEWAAGIWSGAEGMLLSISAAALTPLRNITGAYPNTWLKVVSVNRTLKTVTVIDSNATGAITGTGGVGSTIIVATDVLFPYGARNEAATVFGTANGNWGVTPGLDAITSNLGTLYGINAATAGMWAGNLNTTYGTPSIGKILDAASIVNSTGQDKDLLFVCSPKHFARLNSDQTALRVYQGAGSTWQQGANKLVLSTDGDVTVTIRSHRFCKDGYAYLFSPEDFMRVGSSELRFNNLGTSGDVYLQTTGFNTVQLRAYLAQTLFCRAISRTVRLTGIIYT